MAAATTVKSWHRPTLKWDVNDGTAFDTPVVQAEITDFTLPTYERTDIKTTHLNSAQNVDTFIPGGADPGIMTVTINWIPAAAAIGDVASTTGITSQLWGAASLAEAGHQIWKWQITFDDSGGTSATVIQGSGYVRKIAPVGDNETDPQRLEIEIRMSGVWTVTKPV